MTRHSKLPLLALAIFLAAAPALQAAKMAVAAAGKAGTTRIAFLGLASEVPATWQAERPATSSRLAQFRIPGAKAAQPAQFIVYYFGPGQGGSADNNITRWKTQFFGPDGAAVTPRVDRFKVAGMAVTTAEFQGAYARGIGIGPKGVPTPDQILLAAVVESPRGNLIIQLFGPHATVRAQRSAFTTFIRRLRPASE